MLKFKSGDSTIGIKDIYVKEGNTTPQIASVHQVRVISGIRSLETLYEYMCKHGYLVTEHVDPTCKDSGHTTYTCSKCGDTYTETLDPIEHGPLSYESCGVSGGAYGRHYVICDSCGLDWTEDCTEDDMGFCIYCGETVA